MKTTFTYNGVLVKDVLTDSIEAFAEKDSTGVDQAGVRYVCTFSGIVHQAAQNRTGKQLGSIQNGLYPLLQALTKDRRRFTLKIGGATIIDVGPGAAEPNAAAGNVVTKLDQMDIANGPVPHLQVTKFTGGIAATIRFTVQFTIPNCGGPGTAGNSGLINFRFWISEDIDCHTWLTTRTYQGRIRVAHANIQPHVLARAITIPPLEDGFQRRIVAWHEQEDGLHLDFTFQDVEQIASAPWNRFANVGAVSWHGNLTCSTEAMGATGRLSLNFSLTGDKNTSKPDLIDIGFRICTAKAKLAEAIAGLQSQRASSFLESLSVSEELHANTVSFDCNIRHTGDNNLIAGLLNVGTAQVLGKPLGKMGIDYDPEVHFQPGPSAGIGGIFHAVLQTPCQPSRMPRNLPPKDAAFQSGRTQRTQPTQSQNLEQTQAQTSQSHREAVYLEYLMASELKLNTGKIALPTGAEEGASGNSGSQSTSDTLAIVNLHRPTCRREIRIDASRLNKDPELPDLSKNFRDANGILHTPIGEIHLITSVPQLSADSRNYLHRTQLQALYAMSRAPKSGESLPVGTLPYRTTSLADQRRVIPWATFIPPERILR